MIPCKRLAAARANVLGLAQEYPAGAAPVHAHEAFGQILYVVRGAVSVRTPTGIVILPPQRALWIPPGVPHAFSHLGPVSMRTVYVRRGDADLPKWEQCTVLHVSALLRELILALMSIPWDYASGSSGDRLSRVLLDNLTPVHDDGVDLRDPGDARAVRAAAIARDDAGHRLSLREISLQAGASERTLNRLFMAETNMGFGAWRRCLRLMGALESLARGEPISAIAEAIGYVNPSSFIAAFKATFGTTPARYFPALAGAASSLHGHKLAHPFTHSRINP